MKSGDAYRDGEENASPALNHRERGSPAARSSGRAEPGGRGTGSSSGSGSGEDDVEMNPDSMDRIRCRLSSANQSPGSVMGFSSTKSTNSVTGSSSCSLHSTACSQSRHHADCSEQVEQGRDHTHREMMQTVQEMKKRLPTEKRSRGKPSTVEALNYALNCVKQVQANSEYYKLLMCKGQEERKDAAVCTLEQLENITSEHTLKNTDTFVVVFSLATGRVVYASEQASSFLNCKRKFLESAKFVELLFHQDVNVFYSHTAQPHLPPWNVGSDSVAVLFQSAQVKSFFCRIRGGKDRDGEMRYNPFRITPYLLKVQGAGGEEEHPCCLALAEPIISGYEAPRIPMDKRIFTTTHSPGCVFLEVDDRAVPLLGYLPQDLIGTSVLTCLHPEDRTLMLATHRQILKYAGQPPFEHSPIRFRCQNGDYVTLDTSWSSFVNPWSRKVAFIIGRHKVRTGPLNEDVFAARHKDEFPVMHEDVKELQAMIYKLFLQPVHTNGSSGYGSLGSNGSHEHYISVASSSDSNGNLWEDSHREPVTLQQICANVNKVKSGGQQAYLDSRQKLTPLWKSATETPASVSHGGQHVEMQGLRSALEQAHRKQTHIPSYQQINCVDSIIRYLESCSGPALKRKSKSLSITTSSSSTTSEEEKTPTARLGGTVSTNEASVAAGGTPESQVSTSSVVTVAHTTAAVVGAPLTDITLSTKAMSVMSVTSQCSYSSTIVHVPQPESEVTALEDAPIGSEQADSAPAPSRPAPSSSTTAQEGFQVVGLTKEVLSAHTQKEEQEYVNRIHHRILESPYSSYLQQDNSSMAHSNHRGDYVMRPLSTKDWNRSNSGKPRHKRAKPQASSDSDGSPPGLFQQVSSPAPNNSSSESSQPKPNFFSPMLMPVQHPYYPGAPQEQPQGVPIVLQPEQMQPVMQVMNPLMAPVMAVFLPYPASYGIYPQAVPSVPGGLAPAGLVPLPYTQPPFMSMRNTPPLTGPSAVPPTHSALLSSPPSSPWPEDDVDTAQPTALFSSSRSSSPLQLNLLQEEMPKPAAPQSSTGCPESLHEPHAKEDSLSDSGNQDARSTSSVLLDLLLHEDARSGTGSNVSGSGSGESGGSLGSGSGSNGTSTSHTGSSKYFASNDSDDTSRKARKSQEAQEHGHFNKCPEDSLWTMIQNTPEPVMMTYQIHPRDHTQVLKQDREKLLLLQPMQPWFTREQKEELAEVHSWIQHHTIPEEINIQGCESCDSPAVDAEGSVHSPSLPTPDSSSTQDCPSDDISPVSAI